MTHTELRSPAKSLARLFLGPLIFLPLLAACADRTQLPQPAAPGPATPPTDSAADGERRLPSFADFPATETFTGDPAPVDLDSHPQARAFRTALTRDAAAGAETARFAGHYRIVVIGCGTSCKSVWAVDLVDGSVHDLFTASYGVAFRPDSRLIVANDPATYERLLEEMTPTELEQLIATYGPPRFWIERDGAFERIGPWRVQLDAETGKLAAAPPGSAAASWRCANDLEVVCADRACAAETGDAFTPMSVTVDGAGALSVCAYTGCWEGTARVVEDERFLIVTGQGLEFSTAAASRVGAADIALVIDRADQVATLKVGEFAHPLLCELAG